MFGLGKSREASSLDMILTRLQLAFENNYKDNARDDLKLFETKYQDAVQNKKLKEKEILLYGEKLEELKQKLKDFHH